MRFRKTAILFAALSIAVTPVSGFAQPVSFAKTAKAGKATSSVSGLKETPDAFAYDGKAAGQALKRETGESAANMRGGAEAEIYRRISPSVVLVLTKEGLGSGSLINADGTIVTNYHVIEGYKEVGILFKPEKEGEELDSKKVLIAEVIKFDEVTDLALVKLKTPPAKLPQAVAFGDFNKVAVGDDVNAIGHPTGQTWTFTRGYVSQIRRNYDWKISSGVEHKADVIQTQTPINPGNSGGPLLNTKGELVGVNAFKDEGEGLNFAIGVTTVNEFLKRKGNRGGENAVATTKGSSANASGDSKCKPQVVFAGRDEEDKMDVVEYDRNCNGVVDMAYIKPDDKKEPVRVFIDNDEDGKSEGIILSYKQDDYFNISFWDSDGDGKVDIVGYHPDGKLKPSSFGPYVES